MDEERRIACWRAPGLDVVHGFQYKKLSKLHGKIATELQETLEGGTQPELLMIGRTIFIMKDAKKGKVASNFRPNACLQLMWKLFTDIFAETTYNHFLHNPPPPNEKKGCREESRGVKDQLLIHKAFLQNYKRTCKNLAMGLTDYKNTYDMVPQSWLKEAMELV